MSILFVLKIFFFIKEIREEKKEEKYKKKKPTCLMYSLLGSRSKLK